MSEDPLAKLFVRKEELNRDLLAEVLAPFVRLSQDTGDVVLLPSFAKLTNAGKILVFLLAKKAAMSAGLPLEREGASPKEISEKTGMNYDSARPTLSALSRKRILQKTGDVYFVPDHAILTIREMVSQP